MSVCIIGGSIGCVDLGGGVDWWIDGAFGQEEDGAIEKKVSVVDRICSNSARGSRVVCLYMYLFVCKP